MRPCLSRLVAAALLGVTLLLLGVIGYSGLALLRRLELQDRPIAEGGATAAPPLVIPATAPGWPTAAIIAPPTQAATPSSSPPFEIPAAPSDLALALAPSSQDALAQHPDVPLYRIGAWLEPSRRQIIGAQIVHLTNTEDVPLEEIYFRLYANAPHYHEGGMVVAGVRVDGRPAEAALQLDDTALRIGLSQPLAPGASVEISMGFATSVPASAGYGIFGVADGIFALYNWHPELAVYEHGGWLLHPAPERGDPTNTDAANYVVQFVAPAAYTIVTSGVERRRLTASGEIVTHSVAALARNFVVVASNRFEQRSEPAGEVTITSYHVPGSRAGARAALSTAAQAIELFSARFGPYPYSTLDVAQVPLGGGIAGMESTGLILISSDIYGPPGASPLPGLEALVPAARGLTLLAFITAHEVAHQWWYGAVGSDAYTQPWLDEGLTNWSAAFYFDQVEGPEVGRLARDIFVALAYRLQLEQADMRLDQPVDRFESGEYSAIVYGKGALIYDVLRQQIGDEAFFAFLRRYYQQHRFARASGDSWRAVLGQTAGAEVADAFYAKWVEGASIVTSDLPPPGPMSELFLNREHHEALPTPGES